MSLWQLPDQVCLTHGHLKNVPRLSWVLPLMQTFILLLYQTGMGSLGSTLESGARTVRACLEPI